MPEMHFGVDVSTWNTNCDYRKAVSDGKVEFAMIRAGFGKNAATQKDNMFDTHYAGFKAAGVPMGAYQYSYAMSPADAVKEAHAMLSWIEGKEFALPLFLDMEEASAAKLGKEVCTMIALSWCDTISAEGYKCGVYANPNWFANYLDADRIAEKYLIWCASWGTKKPEYKNMILWQFGGEENYIRSKAVSGIGKTVDQNYYYGSLPSKEDNDMVNIKAKSIARQSVFDKNGNKEAGRAIFKGDICTVRRITDNLFIEVEYPIASGTRVAYVKTLECFKII